MWLLEKYFSAQTDIPKSDNTDTSRESKLLEVVSLLTGSDIDCFVTQGTCLGLIREGKLIEYDHDIDIAFYATDIDKLKALLPTLTERGFYIEEVTRSNLRLKLHNCKATMDLWILYKPNFLYRILGYKWWINNALFRTDYFSDDIKDSVSAYESTFRIPAYIETYLVEHYGETWKTPQKGHNAIYRSVLSQILNTLFVDSPMPSKFSGVDHMNTWKPWASWVLRTFLPKAKITSLYRHEKANSNS